MIFVDSDVPMYLVGADHPNKSAARAILERLIGARERLVTGAEVFQEILHRYIAIERRRAIAPAWDALAGVVDEVFPLDPDDVELARDMVLGHAGMPARDAVHAAVMHRHGIQRIMSFDGGFDAITGITRIS
ncbi:MAG: type II toxin-antitoxin system VapC family toxin [Actinomycetota bacterium]